MKRSEATEGIDEMITSKVDTLKVRYTVHVLYIVHLLYTVLYIVHLLYTVLYIVHLLYTVHVHVYSTCASILYSHCLIIGFIS